MASNQIFTLLVDDDVDAALTYRDLAKAKIATRCWTTASTSTLPNQWDHPSLCLCAIALFYCLPDPSKFVQNISLYRIHILLIIPKQKLSLSPQ